MFKTILDIASKVWVEEAFESWRRILIRPRTRVAPPPPVCVGTPPDALCPTWGPTDQNWTKTATTPQSPRPPTTAPDQPPNPTRPDQWVGARTQRGAGSQTWCSSGPRGDLWDWVLGRLQKRCSYEAQTMVVYAVVVVVVVAGTVRTGPPP